MKRNGHMTRRRFVGLGAVAGGAVILSGLVGCGKASQPSSGSDHISASANPAPESESPSTASGQNSSSTRGTQPARTSTVYLARTVDSAALRAVFAAIGHGLGDGRIGVKLSTGEPGGDHYLKADLIADLVHAVNGTIVECNTAYGGGRSSTEQHYQVAADHGFTSISGFQIMDEDGSLALPVSGGLHLSEDLVGAHFAGYDGFLVLSHFKGHTMAGFGGALKNISIGMASREGKLLIRSAGESSTSWTSAATPDFLESMADACQAVLAAQPNMLFVNVMNNLSVDCDCDRSRIPTRRACRATSLGIRAVEIQNQHA